MTFKFSILSIGLILILSSSFKNDFEVTQEQAVKLAEQFVRDNGYTIFPADTSKLRFELLDRYENSVDKILKGRHNALHPKAFCISENEDRWHVGFLSAYIKVNQLDSIQKQSDLAGRVVIVMKDGTEVRIAHKTPLFSHFKKL